MELYRLKGFLAIMRAGNLTKAAEQLNVSQSALSSQLKQLEEELDLSLFQRSPRGMTLSEAGREMLPFVDALIDAEDQLLRHAQSLHRGGGETLDIGLNSDPGFLRVGAINRRLKQLHNELNVIFLASQTERMPQLLRQGSLDLAFLYGTTSEPDIRCQQLTEVRFCIVIPRGFVGPDRSLDWAEIADLPWIWVAQGSPPYDAVLHQFAKYKLVPNQAVNTVDEYIVKELVGNGQGVAVVREDEARPLVDTGSAIIWDKGWLTLPLNLAWKASHEDRFRLRSAREAIQYLWNDSGATEANNLASFSY